MYKVIFHMRHLPQIIILLGLILFSFACQKESDLNIPFINVKGISLHLLDAYEIDGNSRAIDESSVRLSKDALLSDGDFISYDSNLHTFTISTSGRQRIKDLEHSTSGIPFALLADGALIYTAYFWPSYSSASCDWIVTDPIIMPDNTLSMKLGYASASSDIPDRRNHERLINRLRASGRLIN